MYEASDVEDHLLEANFDECLSLDGEQVSLDGLPADGVNVGRSVSQDSNDSIEQSVSSLVCFSSIFMS